MRLQWHQSGPARSAEAPSLNMSLPRTVQRLVWRVGLVLYFLWQVC